MNSKPIRYCFAILLIGAAMAVVVNPVLHAFSHNHFDDPEDVKECVDDIQWTEQDLCPYCDAVSQYVEPPITEALYESVILQRDSEPVVFLYPDLRLRLSTRLRAPPYLA